MNITITEKDIKATESIKEYIEKKVERLAKYFTEDFDVNVTMKAEGKDQVAEMQLTYEGASFRAITGHTDLYASIDKDIDILEGQIRKMKTKKDKQNAYSGKCPTVTDQGEEGLLLDHVDKEVHYTS